MTTNNASTFETNVMFVTKRNGTKEEISFDKVLNRLKRLCDGLDINIVHIAQKVCSRIYNGVKTCELDELAAQLCSSLMIEHPDYGILASRVIISNHHKNTLPSFYETVCLLYQDNLVSDELYQITCQNKDLIESEIDYNRDYNLDFFGFMTLEKSYLIKKDGIVIERPQHMFMRVAIGIHGPENIETILETYHLMSNQYCIHATPTLFNAGTKMQQMSSCFLGGIHHDSIENIYDTLKEVALISKYAGGIGVHIHNVRAKNSHIKGTNGTSTGIVPMLRVYNNTARYVNQCFAPNTKVLTIEGVKNICDINVNDLVMTRNGEYQNVLQVFKNKVEDREILQFNSPFLQNPIRVTKEHKILVFDECVKNVKYIYADEFDQIKHSLGFPLQSNTVPVSESNEYFKFYGMFLVYGHISENVYQMEIISNIQITFVTQFLTKRGILYTVIDNTSSIIIFWMYTPKLLLSYDYIYDNNGNRRIYPYYLHLPDNQTVSMLEGMSNLRAFTSKSLDIVYNVALLWLRVTQKMLIITKEDNNYTVTFNKFIQGVIRDNKIWFKIDYVEKIKYTGYVYDICVNNQHNYVTNMGIVHNSGKRNGSMAIYLEPWHADIEAFLELRKNNGHEEERARDLFYALWIPDLFMERVRDGGVWSLMCPNKCKGLSDVHSDEFNTLYLSYEEQGLFNKQVNAQDLWFKILESQIETGVPYMLYKDHVNKKNNQKNLGIIKSSNLCTEIMEYTSPDEWAVCNLASICLPTYITNDNQFDYNKLHQVVKTLVRNLNKVIDRNFYPIDKALYSNLKHRPIGIGVQGFADLLVKLRFPFESQEAMQLNKDIFETMYHAALESSNDLAKELSKTYESFKGSPASEGILQFDMWGVKPSLRYDWDKLKHSIIKNGLMNSLLLAPMPTASTSQICGFNESFEPFTSNIYKRKTLAGEFILVNKYLVKDLQELNLWTKDIKNKIVLNEGSIQHIDEIPYDIKKLYKIVWEIKQKTVIDMAVDRGAFIDQSQSMNLFMENPDFKKLSSMHFYSWQKGLKTGMYYLRSKAKAKAQQFTMDPKISKYTNIKNEIMGQESCLSCGS